MNTRAMQVGLVLVGLGLACPVSSALAQATEAEMKAFPMPPAQGYAEQKIFDYVGDFGYFVTPLDSSPGGGVGPGDYRYVRYSGIRGKRVVIWGTWGTTEIPPPGIGPDGRRTDSCFHAHTSYGVWGRFRFFGFSGWSFLGGGSLSGVRNSSGNCVMRVDNPNGRLDPRYGWGVEALDMRFDANSIFTDLVLGVQSNTHGWGSCQMPGFKACLEPSWALAYTVPL